MLWCHFGQVIENEFCMEMHNLQALHGMEWYGEQLPIATYSGFIAVANKLFISVTKRCIFFAANASTRWP